MADKTMTLVAKMTINSKDFEQGLTNAKKSMNDFNSAIENAAKSFGKIMVAIKAAQGALNVFKDILGGTEQGADVMASAMYTAESSMRKFYQTAGDSEMSLRSFIDNLDTIRKNAEEAYEALDKMGTMKMWTNARMSQLKAEIAENRVIINSESSTAQEKAAAKAVISRNTDLLTALSGDLAEQTTKAAKAKLREISGAGKEISDEMLKYYIKLFEEGTLDEKANELRKRHAKYTTWESTVYSPGGWAAYNETRGGWVWDDKHAENVFNAMRAIATVTEGEGGLKDYYDLLTEEAAMRMNVANQINKANKAIKETGGGAGSSSSKSSEGLTLDQQIQLLSRSLQYELLNNEHLQEIAVIDFDIPEEEIEDDAATIERAVAAARQRMEELALATKQAFGAADQLAAAFLNMGKIADGTLGDVFTMLGSVIGQIISTMQAMMTLAGAETIEGVAEVFANSPGGVWTKLAIAGAGAAGILGIIASVKSSFAGSFAQGGIVGGIVGGNSYSGDKLFARVNSGEMILNRQQQAALFGGQGGNVHFVIEGSQLKGVLDNYNKTTAL